MELIRGVIREMGPKKRPQRKRYPVQTMLLFVNAVLLGPGHLPIPGVE